jgi:hypothetical protein
MPTLRQVNIHPRTRERLSSGHKRKRSISPSSSSLAANNCNEPPPDNVAPAAVALASAVATSSSASFVPIRTPSALLSRDPAKLSTDLNTSVRNIHVLREGVAREIISNPYSGHARHASEVAEAVTKYCCCINDNGGDDGNDEEDDATNTTNNKLRGRKGGSQQQQHHGITRPKPLLAGAITALDMCAHARYIKNMHVNRGDSVSNQQQHCSTYLSCIRTGSNAIDTLLAPDHSYSSFDDGWSMPYPFRSSSENNTDDEMNLTSSYSTQSGYDRGVPYGMVTEFAGPPSSGKTQLALSIAAHAVMRNGLKVHYISGGNSRRAITRRLYTMFAELARSTTDDGMTRERGARVMTEEEVRSMVLKKLETVHVSSVPDAYSLLALLSRIDVEEVAYREVNSDAVSNKKRRSNSSNGTLLIIDSVSSCLGHHLASDAGAALASQVASTLRSMARTHDGHIMHMKGGQLRRFAVIVTNGSVAKRSFDNDSNGYTGARTQPFGKHSKNQPAMGQYWHVSDVGIWLEEDDSLGNDDSSSSYHSFYENNPPVALSLVVKKTIRASLLNHYGKSSKCNIDRQHSAKSIAKFSIRSGGISDVQ